MDPSSKETLPRCRASASGMKRKRSLDESDDLNREELVEMLREERGVSKKLRMEMEDQRKRFEQELKAEKERYQRNEDSLWRMIEGRIKPGGL